MTHDPFLPPDDILDDTLYGVSPELVTQIATALAQGDPESIAPLIAPLHTADVADLITRLNSDARRLFLDAFKNQIEPEVFSDLEENVRLEVLEALGTEGIAAAVSELESDDAIEVIQTLEEDQQQEVLQSISASERAFLEEVMTYPEESAGRLMQREIVCVPTFWTVSETLTFIRENPDLPITFYTIYVIDPQHAPVGELSLGALLRQPLDAKVVDIMEKELTTILVTKDQEEVARAFRHYGFVSAPVVDATGRIVGMITVDDVVDVIEEEVEEDILNIAKVHETDLRGPAMSTAYWRIRWLLITLVNTLIASFVISRFQGSIQQITALSFLMTINAAMGGNAGMQVVTIVIRALGNGTLREREIWQTVSKEMTVGIATGSFFALLLGSIAGLWVHDIRLGFILSLSVFFNILWAAFAGTMLPLTIHRMGLDPAISAGPILTTTTDVFGYAIFLGLATLILL